MTDTKYNHAVDLGFSVESSDPDGGDFTPSMLKEALLKRIADLDLQGGWVEAVGLPYDTYTEEG